MKVHHCPGCGTPLPFESLACLCGMELSYDPENDRMLPLADACGNRQQVGCNWQAATPGGLCRSCEMTAVIPDTFHGDNRDLWAASERAKRWVLANLMRLGWFTSSDDGPRPVFHLLAEETAAGSVPVTMGHAEGVVTINVTEADDAERTQRRTALGERLRTMIGHYRHELGHFFFFERLSPQEGFTDRFRALFGDERADYGEALEIHYRDGAPPDWNQRHVTPYASSHPHEDWAESFAHLLHLTDLTDSFVAAGLRSADLPSPDYEAYRDPDGERLITAGAGLGLALNHVNRSMGIQDIYPFVLTPVIREKLAFVNAWSRRRP
ncbi:putative zinc-binding metallopeptidase [Oricola sp.]|uniref:zinc-binding metallopeptidase family protein n=1 Tax=Oricola sp. TaxID=1979950 RepID=UPI0025FD72E5|nr:putative zinc-binding metallopeptidase [Oricola sp.]MCI5074278.1 putative zinc-binding peptidase [Oricola sp.]